MREHVDVGQNHYSGVGVVASTLPYDHWNFVLLPDPPKIVRFTLLHLVFAFLSWLSMTTLALYREGRSAEQNFMISCAVLSYFKVLEVRYSEGKLIKPWIAAKFPLLGNGKDDNRVTALLAACGDEAVEEYLWKACRVAVAHVREKHPSDPDSADELGRLHNAAGIMRRLARYFIREELGVSDNLFQSGAETALPIAEAL